jgi:hypothetical protein
MHRTFEILAVIGVAAVTLIATARAELKIAAMRAHDAELAGIRRRLFDEVRPVNVTNCNFARFGAANDGGYLVCANLLGAVTAAYSYGIEGRDEWGCQISETLKVPVHEYDCFDLRHPSCPDGTLVFHPECVGPARSTQQGRPFDSLASQIERNDDSGRRLVMKMDVEGAEWDTFLATPDSVFEQTDQLVMEFHGVDEERFVRAVERLKRFFVFAHLHYNNGGCKTDIAPFPSWVFEALLVNRRLAQTDGGPAPQSPLPNLDAPNGAHSPDCQ